MPSITGATRKQAGVFYNFGENGYNVKHPNAGMVCDSVIDDRAAFNTLVNVTMQPNGGDVEIVGIPRIASNMTIPTNVHMKFLTGAFLSADVGVTVTVNGTFDNQLKKKFGGAGTFVFGPRTKEFFPEWLGIVRDGVADDTILLRKAITIAQASALKVVSISSGDSVTDDLSVSGTGMSIEGVGLARMYGSTNGASAQLSARNIANVTMLDCAPAGGLGYPTDPMMVSVKHLHLHGRDKAANGLKTSASALIEDVTVQHCKNVALWIAQYTNSTRMRGVAGVLSGTGLLVTGNPNATTPFTVEDGNFELNTGTPGAIIVQAGVHASFINCIVESNVGPGLNMFRFNAVNMGYFEFRNCWFEDNGSGAAFSETLNFDSETRDEAHATYDILFDRCRFNPSVNGRRYMLIACVKNLEFRDCDFAGTTLADAIVTTATCFDVVFVRCKGITQTQMLSAMATGNERVWFANEKFAMAVVYSAWIPDPSLNAWKDREGNVQFSGGMKSGIIGAGNTAFVLPLGLRPSVAKEIGITSSGIFTEINIAVTGEVTVVSGNNLHVSFDGVSFSAA